MAKKSKAEIVVGLVELADQIAPEILNLLQAPNTNRDNLIKTMVLEGLKKGQAISPDAESHAAEVQDLKDQIASRDEEIQSLNRDLEAARGTIENLKKKN